MDKQEQKENKGDSQKTTRLDAVLLLPCDNGAYEVVAPSATPEPTPEPTAEPTQVPTPEPTQEPAQPSNLPKTGDTFMPLLYVGLGAASLGMVVVLLLVRRNKKAEK